MLEVALEGLGKNTEEGTIQTWFFEEGDPVQAGDDLLEVSTDEGTITVTAPAAGILAEVYYDEGEMVGKGEVLCLIDTEDEVSEKDSEEDEDEEEDADSGAEEDDEDSDDEDFEDEEELEDEDGDLDEDDEEEKE